MQFPSPYHPSFSPHYNLRSMEIEAYLFSAAFPTTVMSTVYYRY